MRGMIIRAEGRADLFYYPLIVDECVLPCFSRRGQEQPGESRVAPCESRGARYGRGMSGAEPGRLRRLRHRVEAWAAGAWAACYDAPFVTAHFVAPLLLHAAALAALCEAIDPPPGPPAGRGRRCLQQSASDIELPPLLSHWAGC